MFFGSLTTVFQVLGTKRKGQFAILLRPCPNNQRECFGSFISDLLDDQVTRDVGEKGKEKKIVAQNLKKIFSSQNIYKLNQICFLTISIFVYYLFKASITYSESLCLSYQEIDLMCNWSDIWPGASPATGYSGGQDTKYI